MCFSEISALHSLARCLSSVKQVSIAAVDLGASSGRVIAARVGPGSLSISEANRFANGPVRFGTTLRWDVSGLVRGMLEGLRLAELGLGQLDGAAIDSWAMDYGALDADGALLADPFCYRDDRTVGVMAKAFAVVPRPELYDRTGIQFLPLQHDLPAHCRGRDATGGGHGPSSPDTRSPGLSTYRSPICGDHECVDHTAARLKNRSVGPRPGEASRHPAGVAAATARTR